MLNRTIKKYKRPAERFSRVGRGWTILFCAFFKALKIEKVKKEYEKERKAMGLSRFSFLIIAFCSVFFAFKRRWKRGKKTDTMFNKKTKKKCEKNKKGGKIQKRKHTKWSHFSL